jgi:hypothetical protein
MATTKTLLLSLLSLLTLISVSVALPEPIPASTQPRAACTSPKLRKEWSSATAAEKQCHIKAVKCLTNKKSSIGLKSTLYDDFPFVHNALTLQSSCQPIPALTYKLTLLKVHGVAAFLP